MEEISECVEYVKSYKAAQAPEEVEPGMVVLMGHSTGSQDVLHYIYAPNPLLQNPDFDAGLKYTARPPVDGAILQSPVSDREGLLFTLKSGTANNSPETLAELYTQAVGIAKKQTYTDDKQDVAMPVSLTAKLGFPGDVALSCRRFLSLASPDSPQYPREDDLFSSDLDDERLQQTFGKIGPLGLLQRTLLVLPGGSDQYVPGWVSKEDLLRRWENATTFGAGEKRIWDELSGLVPGATHSPSQAEPRRELASRVTSYLKKIENSS